MDGDTQLLKIKQSLAEMREQLLHLKAKRDVLVDKQKNLLKKRETEKANAEFLNTIRTAVQEIATDTQQKLEFHVSSLVTMALEAVFPDPYEFQVEFVPRRGQTEANLWFVKNNEKMSPLGSSGGGAVDVASFALRPTFLNLSKTSRPLLILDEPFKHLSEDLQDLAAEMVETVSKELGIQIIIVTHIRKLAQVAGKIFATSQDKNGVTTVKEVSYKSLYAL